VIPNPDQAESIFLLAYPDDRAIQIYQRSFAVDYHGEQFRMPPVADSGCGCADIERTSEYIVPQRFRAYRYGRQNCCKDYPAKKMKPRAQLTTRENLSGRYSAIFSDTSTLCGSLVNFMSNSVVVALLPSVFPKSNIHAHNCR